MIPPTLREVCERATKGPWKSSGGTVRVDSPNRYEQERVCVLSSPSGAAPEAWEAITDKRNATAQLIARCDPQTMLAVIEALEAICEADDRHELAAAIPKCLSALAALNRTP